MAFSEHVISGQRVWLVISTVLLTALVVNIASAEPQRGAWARLQGPGVVDLPSTRAFPAYDEFRIGVMHAVDGPGEDEGGSPDINLEILLGRFGSSYHNVLWNHFLRPRIHFGGSISTDSGTSLAYAGLTWDVFLTRRLFLEGSFGGALHDGPDNEFGCSVNFRESGSVGITLAASWDIMATVDHMSNAGLCDENRGLTTIGIRLGRKF
jgi:lipid A 3-O-deacylase